MIRILIIASIFAVICPTISSAGDISLTPMQRLEALTSGSNADKRITPMPKALAQSCAGRGSACGPGYPKDCCTSCYFPPGNTHGECQ